MSRATPSGEVIRWEPYRPGNGTEGDIFMSGWCERCKKDTRENPCSIIARTMAFDVDEPGYPAEWRRQVDDQQWPGTAQCTAFEAAHVNG